ncbi:MAG TPA: hypothetical protein VHZ55_22525 [Bryobacteraceae bacterium]|jgi:hypothetical protein|nr:hypothetical protein [Bryobacteraceae bacterium]
MCRNVDLWAIGVLLLLTAVFSEVRQSSVVFDQSRQLVEFTAGHVAPFSELIQLPKLCLTRD